MVDKSKNTEKTENPVEEIQKIPAGVTQVQIENWKKKHGVIKLITVKNDEGEPLSAIFKQPDMDILSAVVKKSKIDEIESVELLYNSCKLASDDEIEGDISLKLSVAKMLKDLVSQRTATIKKL